jgi:Fe-S cluster assembly scaffold protein SufB
MRVEKEIKKNVKKVGIDLDKETPKYLQLDFDPLIQYSNIKGLEILNTKDALKKYPWLKSYFWKLVNKESDEYTRYSFANDFNGYFIRAKKNVKVQIPIQTCLYLKTNKLIQNVHNIIIAEEGSELNIITGCTIARHISGKHIGISEFFLKKNSKINFTMIHAWNEETEVFPRTGAILEENSTFVSNYILLTPTKRLQTSPRVTALRNSKVILKSLLFGRKNSFIDVGGEIILKGSNSSGLIESRIVAKNKSNIVSRGKIVAEGENSKGHIECRGLLVSRKAETHAIPELTSKNDKSELTHEASVGKIKDEELWYLMSRGLNEEEATNMIISGFLNPEFLEIPDVLRMQIRAIIEETKGKS